MTAEWIFVTVEMALKILENNTHNRALSQRTIDRYKSMIKSGDWIDTHQGIAITDDGLVLDGQHRLWAIVEAKQGVWLWVFRGVPKKAQLVIDTLKPRNAADCITLEGELGDIDKTHVSIARAMRSGISAQGIGDTVIEVKDFLRQHLKAIQFGISCHVKCKFLTSTVRAVCARAWYTEDERLIKSFVACFVTGICHRGAADSAPVLLSRWIASMKGASQSRMTRTELYKKSERALRAYLDSQPIARLYETNEELFPVPGEAAFASRTNASDRSRANLSVAAG